MKAQGVAVPYVVWMAGFVVAPLVLVTCYAFTSRDGSFTLHNFNSMYQYTAVFGRSFFMAFVATVICLLIGYPLAYYLSRESALIRKISMMLIMLPMWINFLLRTYAWMALLEDTGLINQFLAFLHLPTFHMINTPGAVVLGMVYNYLPFMILPIFSVIDRIDLKIIEAAQDLGASSTVIFRRVVFPLSLPGVLSGITMVFIPSVSTFALSRLLGGGKTMLLGDLIEMQFLGSAYNPHLGSAIALAMMIIVLVCMAVMNRFGEGEEGVSVL